MPSIITMEDTLKRFKELEKELINSEIILNYSNNKAQVLALLKQLNSKNYDLLTNTIIKLHFRLFLFDSYIYLTLISIVF